MEVSIDDIDLLEEAVEMEELETRWAAFKTHANLKFNYLNLN